MQTGIADHDWPLEEIAGLVPKPIAKKPASYKKRESKVDSPASGY